MSGVETPIDLQLLLCRERAPKEECDDGGERVMKSYEERMSAATSMKINC